MSSIYCPLSFLKTSKPEKISSLGGRD